MHPNTSRLLLAACLWAASATATLSAQTIRTAINDGWQFVRLSDAATQEWTAGQQGTDWNSQFNIQHADDETLHTTLALTDSIVRHERAAMANETWEEVRLPHTAYMEPLVILHPWQGVCYYRRHLRIDARQAAGVLLLEFEGAMQLADIWINGQHALQHPGGFTSFVVDATGLLQAGDNEITVRLDNRNNALIPPGKPLEDLDFCYHSGLYRDVWLISKPKVCITHPLLTKTVAGGGVFVTYPSVAEEGAVVKVRTEVENRLGEAKTVSIRQTLFDWDRRKGKGRAVAQTTATAELRPDGLHTAQQQLSIRRPRLWSPDEPNLYLLRTEVMEKGKTVDAEETKIGIRRIEITKEGCFINGKRFELDGANRHQEYPYVGNAISDYAQYRDIWQMKTYGFNTVRLGHYPQDPSVLEACDELGLLAIEPIPGWQFFNNDPRFTKLTYRDVQQMIRRDRNHPCILLWETTLNESWPPTEWKDGAVRTAHAEMPDGQCFTSGDAYGYSGFDVCYNDWDQNSFSRPNNSTKPAFIREYYDYEFGGHYSTTRVTLGDGERAQRQNLWNLQWSFNSNRTSSQNTIGGAVWSMYDYNRGCCDNICHSGLADLFRRPKYGLCLFRAQIPHGKALPSGKMPYEIFVASRWDEMSPDTLVVVGNVEEVGICIDGKEMARKRADTGGKTPYSPQTNGGNCDRLAYPPFTFTDIPHRKGELLAIGYDGEGKEVARQRLRAVGRPSALALEYFEGGVPPHRNDVVIVYAMLKDANGTPCHTNGLDIELAAQGGTIVGPSVMPTEDGVASFVIQTGDAKAVGLTAKCGSMKAVMRMKLAR